MRYITGIVALGTFCERDTRGLWNIRRSDYLDEENMRLRESNESPFKDYGIERNKIISYHEFTTYNVADHVRAYVDLLYDGKFDFLKGVFADAINDSRARKDIFMLVYGKLRHLAIFKEINEFMEDEFGSAWISYKQAVQASAEHIANHHEEMLKLDVLQSKLGTNGKIIDECLGI